jgi:sugar-phosphatase
MTTEIHVAAILFDLDGTLVNSTRMVDETWREIADELGVPFERFAGQYHGVPAETTLRAVVPELSARDLTVLAQKLVRRQALGDYTIVAAPGALSLLEAVPDHLWAIVTSAGLRLAEASLTKAGLPMPDVLVTRDDVVHGKPHPEPFLLAAQRLRLAPARCLAVEDSPAGLASARSAGARTLGVGLTHEAHELAGADWVVDDLRRISVRPDGEGLSVEIRD